MNEAAQFQWQSHRIHTKYHNPIRIIPILNPVLKSLSPTHNNHTS